MSNEKIESIWQIVAQIPKGKVASYGQVAKMAGFPSHARFVGRVLKQLPKDSSLPWHRVIRSDGNLAFPPESATHKKQRQRLLEENVEVEEKVSMRIYQWQP